VVRGSNQHLAARQSAFHIILEWRARAVQNAIRISTSVRNLLRNRWSRTHRRTNSQHFAIHSFPLPISSFCLASSGGFCAVDVAAFLQLRNGGLLRQLHWQHCLPTAKKQTRNVLYGPRCPSTSPFQFYNHFWLCVSMLNSTPSSDENRSQNMFHRPNVIKTINSFPLNENCSSEFCTAHSMLHILQQMKHNDVKFERPTEVKTLIAFFPGFNSVCNPVGG
jgi:hypothetical protein